jgi:hypothetical protein
VKPLSTKDAGIGIGLVICHRSLPRTAAFRVQIVRTAAHIFTSRFRCRRLPGPILVLSTSFAKRIGLFNELLLRRAIVHAIARVIPTIPKYRSIYPLETTRLDSPHDTVTRRLPSLLRAHRR